MHHFWATGADGFVDRMWVEYFVDGESTPSVSMQPAMACGMGYPEVRPNGKIEYAAGGLCGERSRRRLVAYLSNPLLQEHRRNGAGKQVGRPWLCRKLCECA